MVKYQRVQNRSSRTRKFVKWFITFVGILMIVGVITEVVVIAYFVKNPDLIGSWIGKLIRGLDK
ncbi:hypothetical protein NSQ62_07930 [Solibacillus sp. FSL H8-0523]|uniref:hypothetical protein n=1 Tax=Solibacillus sp. FSL H8-0523 TaxID=2954511 RepID=UPI0031019547